MGYVPIQIGAALNQIDDIQISDDYCDNISLLNPEFCELTATYWVWKNDRSLIVGINHYRRFFSNKGLDFTGLLYHVKRFLKSTLKLKLHQYNFWLNDSGSHDFNNVIKQSLIERFVYDQNKVIIPFKYFLNNTVEQHYNFNSDYVSVLKIIVSKSDNDIFKKAFNKSLMKSALYPCNMMICKKEFFNEYCELIFPILMEHYSYFKSRNDKYHRTAGYMGELLTNAFIQYKMKCGQKFKKLRIIYYAH